MMKPAAPNPLPNSAGPAEPALPAEFDAVAPDYEALHAENVKASGYSTAYFAEYKVKEIAGCLARRGGTARAWAVLNFGCGIGNTEGFIPKYLPAAEISAVDVSQKSVDHARARHRDALPRADFRVYDGKTLPWEGQRFDAILVANVLHHVPRAQHAPLLRMLRAALRPAGQLFLFEHNPWNPVTVRAVETCAFDRDAVLLSPIYARQTLAAAGFRRRTLRFTLFFPKALAFLTPLEKFLRPVPLGAQYYFIAAP